MVSRALLALLCVGLAWAADPAAESNVLTMTADNFDQAVKDHSFLAVEFYAPWCGHCKKLAPEYETAATQLAGLETNPKIVLANVDATLDENKELANGFGVKGYPTLKIFRNGDKKNIIDYNGPREAVGIVDYLTKQAGPASKELTTVEDAAATLENQDVVVLGFFADTDSAAFKAFSNVANSLREESSFAHTTSEAVLAGARAHVLASADIPPSAPTVALFRKFDEPLVVFTGDVTDEEALKTFISAGSVPLVTVLDASPRNRDALRKLFASDLPKALLFADFESSDTEAVRAALKLAATAQTGKLLFVEGDATANEGALKFFGLDSATIPALVIHDTVADLKYRSDKVTPEGVGTWLAAFAAGEVQPHIKSEEVPEENNGHVKTIVATQFEQIVGDPTKDVFIEFYAPWCGHCKKLAPIWEEIGEHFASNENLIIAQMDSTANDVPNKEYSVKGFPTLYYKQASGKVIAYNGDRSKSNLVDFINKHSTSQPIEHSEL